MRKGKGSVMIMAAVGDTMGLGDSYPGASILLFLMGQGAESALPDVVLAAATDQKQHTLPDVVGFLTAVGA